jgi:hypothetical protein
MKSKLILSTTGLLIVIASLLTLYSCSKSANGNLTKEQVDLLDTNMTATAIDIKDFNESDSDLTTVDYKEFYDQLAPHGEWIQVQPEEIGLKPKTTASKSSGNNSFSLSKLLGITDAYAETDANLGMVYVWSPSSDLAVVTTAGEVPVYTPYSNGQWVNTDAGWYFRAPTPVEETTSHYGRWVNSPTAGWLWVPGRVWAPAWVDWRQNDSYVSWAPLPPSYYMVNGTMSSPVIDNNNYVIVDRQYFLQPNVYQYNNPYYDNGNRIMVSDLAPIAGLMLINDLIVNRGPDVNIFQTLLGTTIELVSIQHVTTYSDVRYLGNQYFVYTPQFTRYRHHDNGLHLGWGPKNYKRNDDFRKENEGFINGRNPKFQDKRKINPGDDSHMKYNGNDKGNKNKGNDNGNQYKGNDNGNKHQGNDNGNKHQGNDKGNKKQGNDNGNKKQGNDNGNKHQGNDNGNKHQGNDNGNKHQGNDNGNKHQGNDNGNKQNGNDHGKGKK